MAKRLAGKVAIITGGARGIGAAAARLFSQHGAKLLITDIQSQLGLSVSDEIQSESGHPVSFIQCDVSNDSHMQNAVDTAVSIHGKLDIMYHNAGIAGEAGTSNILSTNPKVFRNVFDVNVYGSFLAAKHAARVMIPARSGNILLTASAVTASCGVAPHSYAASKHAVVGLTKNLCVELGEFGIRVNCVSPYGVATALSEQVTGLDGKEFEEAFSEKGNLKGKVLTAKDVAEAALNLVSDESKYISGVNLLVDGGYSLISA
ncbi:Secoisolariciresinol dehydrogenase (Fragment) [Linum perenne]